MTDRKRRALATFGVAAVLLGAGVAVAFALYPGGYDWAYTVISRLASNRRNPQGSRWLAGSLLLAVPLLWSTVRFLAEVHAPAGSRSHPAILAVRVGLLGALLLGVEGLLGLEYSRRLDKAHEAIALVTFLAFYGGVLGLYLDRIQRTGAFLFPALLVLLPLCAVGVTQIALYFDQRDLGWVSTDWRELGVPPWLSFALWQWLAVLGLGLGVGILVATAPVNAPGAQTPRSPTDR